MAAFAAAETLSLDGAIGATAADVREEIPSRSKVAVVGIVAPTERLSDYIADELSGALMTDGSLVIVERKDLELVRDELKFQLSGDVDDASAQSVGKLLGAEVIVFGRFDDSYRLRIKAVSVEAEIPSKFRYSYAGWAAIPDEATLDKLKATKGIRFKVLGDGNRYEFRVHTAAVTDGDWYSASFATQKGKVVEVTIPYKKLHQSMQKGARLDRLTITGLSFLTRKSTTSPIKFFDIRPY